MNMVNVRVVRAFYFEGKVLPVSDRPVPLPEVFAREMLAAKKVEMCAVEAPKAAAPAPAGHSADGGGNAR